MTSYLLVALLACGVIEHIHGLDDGISAEFALMLERCCTMQFASLRRILEPPSAERIASHSAASAEAESTSASIVANKSGAYIRTRPPAAFPQVARRSAHRHDHIHPTDQQTPVDNRKEKLIDRVANTRRSRRRLRQCDRPDGRLGYAAAIPVD